MIENLPNYISIVFVLTTLATFVLFYRLVKGSSLGQKVTIISLGMIIWLTVQMLLSINLYYLDTVGDIPPKFPFLGFIPPFVLMFILFNTKKGKAFIDSLSLARLTSISTIRIPVEIVLFWLFVNDTVPELLTFEGANFDILSGISAPFIVYFGFVKQKLSNKVILGWNILCLLLLVIIVVMAVLSFPTVFQQLSFDQPNVGILYFPFFWLPSFIVPIVFFTHFASIRQLMKK